LSARYVCTYTERVSYEWDIDNAEANFRKHGVRFSSEDVGLFEDPNALTIIDDESDPKEQRVAKPHEREKYEAEL
jgi:uncharacterized DUF497 family protein